MSRMVNHWKLGFFVVAAVAMGVAMLIFLGVKEFTRDVVPVYFFFSEPVDGLSVGGEVRFMGIPIGTVSSILAASDRIHVEVEANISVDTLERLGLISKGQTLTEDMIEKSGIEASLNRSLLTGVAVIGIDVPAKLEDSDSYEKPLNALIVPTKESGFADMKTLISGTLGKVNRLLDSSNRAVEDLHTGRLSDELIATLTEYKAVAQSLDRKGGVIDNTNKLVIDVDNKIEALDIKKLILAAENTLESIEHTAATLDLASESAKLATDEATSLAMDARTDLVLLARALEAITRLANMMDQDPSALIWGRTYPGRLKSPATVSSSGEKK